MMTASYSTKLITPKHAAIRTSLGHPRFTLPYLITGKLPELTPERPWLGLEREEYEPLYLAKLEGVGVDTIRECVAELAGGRIPVLLCFCKVANGAWCHRRMFAEWWEKQTGEPVPEL